jgi:predicted O-linked N-acetylglucosamine transferase (SPINDLY family)
MLHFPSSDALITAKFGASVARIVGGDMTVVDVIGAAEMMGADIKLAHELYQLWIRYNPQNSLLYAIYFNDAVLRGQLNDLPGSVQSFRDSIRHKPDFMPPYINLGTALERMGDRPAAVHQWMQVINQLAGINSDSIGQKTAALNQLGRVFEAARENAQAEAALGRSLEIQPRQKDVLQHWISLRQAQCKWPMIQPLGNLDRAAVLGAISPLSLAAYTDDPIFHLANAHRNHMQDRRTIPGFVTVGQWLVPEALDLRPLRIGYISPDLREHAIGFLTAELFALHDRGKVIIHGYYTGPDLPDAQQARIRAGVDHWTDLTGLTDKQAAAVIVGDEIDILVDLGGYTKDTRNKLFALRPAPIIVNWLGFPGSLGSPDHHYVIADAVIIPPTHEAYFSERVRRLPCYQPNDRRRCVASALTRADVGLQKNAFVFCCFNGSQKISSFTFARWMRIMHAVPNSVLWLLSSGESSDARLRSLAVDRGIAAERLVFAERQRNPDHLARYRLADLFLDTSPYGAHTTASDALWMGVPVVTLAGRAFASRVCASLVTAAGMPDLVTYTSEDYIELAVALAHNPSRLADLQDRLTANRDRCALFDTPALVRGLEGLFREMWDDFIIGRLPTPDLRHLEFYNETAVQFDHDAVEWLDEDTYHARYDNALAYSEAINSNGIVNRFRQPKP